MTPGISMLPHMYAHRIAMWEDTKIVLWFLKTWEKSRIFTEQESRAHAVVFDIERWALILGVAWIRVPHTSRSISKLTVEKPNKNLKWYSKPFNLNILSN